MMEQMALESRTINLFIAIIIMLFADTESLG